jgi:hypothetical protein
VKFGTEIHHKHINPEWKYIESTIINNAADGGTI